MFKRALAGTAAWAALSLAAGATEPATTATKREASVPSRATGSFDVKITPITAEGQGPDAAFGRLGLEKQFHGDIEGTSKGEMLTVGTPVEGSGAYVAIERVNCKLQGREGTFTLLHRATMRKNADFDMQIGVVPDSGTGQLAGLHGTLTIRFGPGGAHFYDFDYTLPEAR